MEYEQEQGKNEQEIVEALVFITSKLGATFAKLELKGSFKSIWEEPLLEGQLAKNKMIILSKTDLSCCFDKSKNGRSYLSKNKFAPLYRIEDITEQIREEIRLAAEVQHKQIKAFILHYSYKSVIIL